MSFLDISEEIRQLGAQAEKAVRPYFDAIDEISEYNTEKVLAAFAKNRVAEAMFAGTTGYGYDDKGRDTLDQIYADIFGTEAALMRCAAPCIRQSRPVTLCCRRPVRHTTR